MLLHSVVDSIQRVGVTVEPSSVQLVESVAGGGGGGGGGGVKGDSGSGSVEIRLPLPIPHSVRLDGYVVVDMVDTGVDLEQVPSSWPVKQVLRGSPASSEEGPQDGHVHHHPQRGRGRVLFDIRTSHLRLQDFLQLYSMCLQEEKDKGKE